MFQRAASAYRSYAAIRGWPMGALKLLLVFASAIFLRNEVAIYAVISVALLDSYVKRAVRDDRPLADIGLEPKDAPRGVALGFVAGAVFISAVIGSMVAFGWYRLVASGAARPSRFVWAIGFFALVAVAEEVLARGILFRWCERKAGSWTALAFSSVLFGFGHLANPGATVRSGFAVTVAGVVLGALYLAKRSLWVPIGAHWSWNLFEGPVFGAPVSGAEYDVLSDAATSGPDLWTGAQFGPEEGLVMVLLGCAAAIALLVVAVRRGHLRHRDQPPPAPAYNGFAR